MNHLYCGVDIGKDSAVFSILDPKGKPLDKPKTFKNNKQGFKAAGSWLRKLAKPFKPFDIHLAMEATGVYYLSLAKHFQNQTGIILSTVARVFL